MNANAFIFLAVFAPCIVVGPMAHASSNERPNIIVILTDDQGYGDVGVHGNEHISTPNIDRLAREGTELARFYCSPVCAPTRASLMTGRYYYRTGVIHTSRGGAKMHGDETTIAEALGEVGYATGVFGKWHLGDNYPMRPQDQGFDKTLIHKGGGIGQTPDRPNTYQDPWLWEDGRRVQGRGYCTDIFFDAACRFIHANRRKPFFVYLPTNAPHTPLEIGPEYYQPYLDKGLNDTTAKVYGMITNLDENLSRLLTHLEDLKLRENTIVVYIGDNGPQQNRYNAGLRGRKSWTYEGGIRVPCFVQWPARWQGGRKLEDVAAHIDLLPTLLQIAGGVDSDDVHRDGISLVPLLDKGVSLAPNRRLFFQCHRGLSPKRYQNCAVVTRQYKWVGYPGTFGREDLITSSQPIMELYDLAADCGESRNLAAVMPAVTQELRRAYDTWFDDVKASRDLTPGWIDIDPTVEDPVLLCRYQDGDYRDGRPCGWPVRLVRGGRYRVSLERAGLQTAGSLNVTWLGATTRRTLAADQTSADFELGAGQGVLDIWFQALGGERVYVTDNSTLGNVVLEHADP